MTTRATLVRPGVLAGTVVSLVAAFASACGDHSRAGTVTVPYDETVEVRLGEWFFDVETTRLSAGPTRFVLRNLGAVVHELELIRGTSLSGVEVEEVEDLAPGETREFFYDLSPGAYLFACLLQSEASGRVLSHFDLGMRLEVTVE